MNNFLQRTITGIIFVAVLLGAIYFHYYSFLFLFSVIIIVGLLEFYRIIKEENILPQKIAGIVAALILFATVAVAQSTGEYHLFLINIPVLFIIFLIELFRNKKNPFANIAFTVVGIIYIALPVSLINLIVISPTADYNPVLLLGFFFLLWSYDTGAYLSGRLLGKKKLFERISPKKTWEGAVGGLFISMGIAYIISLYFPLLSFGEWVIMAAIIAVTGTLGDLTESMLKRSADIKDSGSILPGHGGILDRFDALFISIPFVVAYLYLFIAYDIQSNFF